MIESGLVSLLRTDPTTADLIADRIFAVIVPPNAVYPCISYSTMSKPPAVSLDLSAQEFKRVQIDCWSKAGYAEAKSLQSALHVLLDGFQGSFPDETIVDLCTRDVEADYFESDNETFRCMSEYVFAYPAGQ